MRYCLSIILIFMFIVCVIPSFAYSPVISNIHPVNNETDVIFVNDLDRVNLKADVVDPEGNLRYILFETNKTGTWQKILDFNVTSNSTNLLVPFSSLEYGKTYWWRINAKDATGNWTNTSAFKFTTKVKNDITIVPSQPKSGKTTIFLIGKDIASGYVICEETQNVYLIVFSNGLGSITFLEEDYGNAQIVVPSYGNKNFIVRHRYESQISIDAPSNIDINQQFTVSVMAQGVYVPATVYFTSSTNRQLTRQSGTSPLTINLDESGVWSIRAEAFNFTVTKTIVVNPIPIEIDVSDDNIVDGEVMINVNNNHAVVKIKKDDTTWEYQTDTDGEVLFTPPFSGRYSIIATAENQMGTKTFDVKANTIISVKNDKGEPVVTATEGDFLIIQVQDSEGNNVHSNSIEIYGDGLPIQTLTLSDGLGVWKVTPHAEKYSFNFYSDDSFLMPSQLEITGVTASPIMLYVVVIIIFVVIAIIYLLNRYGYIDLGRFKNPFGGIGDMRDDLL